jgi:hypothetical protein
MEELHFRKTEFGRRKRLALVRKTKRKKYPRRTAGIPLMLREGKTKARRKRMREKRNLQKEEAVTFERLCGSTVSS